MSSPFLSIVFPAHNEAERLPETLSRIDEFLRAQAYAAEVIVVENGSSDRTAEIAREFAVKHPYLQAYSLEERGKGRAVQFGMLKARGDYRFFADVDLSMPIEEVNRFMPPALPEVEIAIASREAPGSVRYNEPAYRHFVGRGFNTLVRWLALPGLQDSQCGFKMFRGDIVDEIFPLQTRMGWSFDVELLFIARKRGYRVVEIGIPWYFNAGSKIRVFKDSLQMGMDLIAIRWNALRGRYAPVNGRKKAQTVQEDAQRHSNNRRG